MFTAPCSPVCDKTCLYYKPMKTPKRSRTSCVPLKYSPFARKSFCHDGLTHTYIHNKQTELIILPPLLMREDNGHFSGGDPCDWITASHGHHAAWIQILVTCCQ